ncbi:MAG: hypothetical protein U0401_34610 [Anaerolineae bacterium]
MSDLKNLTRRPEFAAFVGTLFVFIFFGYVGWPTFTSVLVTAGWLNVAAELGLIALPVALVMIAGYLDLSVGSVYRGSNDLRYSHRIPRLARLGRSAAAAMGTFVGSSPVTSRRQSQAAFVHRVAGDVVRRPRPRLRHHPAHDQHRARGRRG